MDNDVQGTGLSGIGEICAGCGKQIEMLDASFYCKKPADDIGEVYHVACGLRSSIKDAIAAEREACANIALAIDSGRGNEKEIARAIRARAALSKAEPT